MTETNMTKENMTKIDIVSGFLGAGKTTLIRELLTDALQGQQTVLIENEFGEIGIDGSFLKDVGIEIREMNSGCICCSLVGDFAAALHEVIETYHPDRIIIEPSGVGKLSDVIGAVGGVLTDGEVELGSAVTVVDVLKCRLYLKNFGEFFENQVTAAGTIILSRTDLEKATDEKVEEAIALLRGLNPGATIITTPIEELGGKKVLETIEGVKIDLTKAPDEAEASHDHGHDHEAAHDHGHDHEDHHNRAHSHEGHHDHAHKHEDRHEHGDDHEDHHDHKACHDHSGDHDAHDHAHDHASEDHHDHVHDHAHSHDHHHHADEIFTSWGRETVRKYTRSELEEILHTLSEDKNLGIILRAKGMVEGSDGTWLYFDMVPEECEIRTGTPEYTGRLCVIGSQLNEKAIAALFERK